jgi:hypothetical protein
MRASISIGPTAASGHAGEAVRRHPPVEPGTVGVGYPERHEDDDHVRIRLRI